MSDSSETKGTAIVVYEDIYDAAKACKHLSSFNVKGRYIVVVYYKPEKKLAAKDPAQQLAELEQLRKKHKIDQDNE